MPRGIVILSICLPVESGFGLMIVGVRIVPSYSGTQSKLVPIQEGISKGELADPAEGILDDAQSVLACGEIISCVHQLWKASGLTCLRTHVI